MNNFSFRRTVLVFSTLGFLAWALALTVFWPLEDYADVTHAYAESTNQMVRGMSIGLAVYLATIVLIALWPRTEIDQPGNKAAEAG